MQSQLDRNAYKTHWRVAADLEYLENRLFQEADELMLAVAYNHGVKEKAANVANFALMIVDITEGL